MNILLFTNIYPNNDPNYVGTPVCHFFTQEWVKMGHTVQVIHFDSLFPKPYYWIGRLFKDKVQAKTGTVAYTDTPSCPKSYIVDNVSVFFVPIFKFIPHKAPKEWRMLRAFGKVCAHLESKGFVPDVITAHFTMPQLQMLYYCKSQWPDVRRCLVLHNSGELMQVNYPNYEELMTAVEVWGLRSKAFYEQFNKKFHPQRSFICYSGIPDEYIQPIKRNFSAGVHKFAFVGSLYQLKRVDITLRALKMAFPDGNFTFTIAGSGAEMDNLKQLCKELQIEKNVTFLGRVKRDVAQQIMADADCFIMVSSREAFGLVYVEAMAKGCITVATRGQGGDGIITDGVDGFLCGRKGPEELVEVIKHVTTLSVEELNDISAKAYLRAKELTNSKVAEHYLAQITEQ